MNKRQMKSYFVVILSIILIILTIRALSLKLCDEGYGGWIQQTGLDGAVYADGTMMDGAVRMD